MDEKSLKTSWQQRIIIGTIAVMLVLSTVLIYVFIVLNNNGSSSSTSQDEQILALSNEYDAKNAELTEAAKPLSEKYFPEMNKFKSEVKAYNSANANAEGLKTKDLKQGSGRTLGDDDTNYAAYYIGWCSDGSIFDSSFDSNDDPTSLKAPLDPSLGLIEGWNQGVVGMQLGGIRQISIPGSLAYGDTRDDICDGANSPLKFIVMAIEKDAKIDQINAELDEIYMKLYALYYGNSGNGSLQ